MGDIIGSIFGTSSSGTEQTAPDPVAQALNQVRLNQLFNFFTGDRPYSQFAGQGPQEAYGTPAAIRDAQSTASNALLNPQNNIDTILAGNLMNLRDYQSSFQPIIDRTNFAQQRLSDTTSSGLGQAGDIFTGNRANVGNAIGQAQNAQQGIYNTGLGTNAGLYGQVSGDVGNRYGQASNLMNSLYGNATGRADADAQRALQGISADYTGAYNANAANAAAARARAAGNYAQTYGLNAAGAGDALLRSDLNYNRAYGTNEANRQRALDLGIGATGNYIDQIARPRIQQELALQGLEQGGAGPAAIARATAESAMPYLSGIEQQYGGLQGALGSQRMGEQTGILQALMGLQGGLGSQYLGQQGGLDEALMQLQGGLGSQRMQSDVGMNEALMQLIGNLGGQQMGLQGQLGGQQMGIQGQLGSQYQGSIADLVNQLMGGTQALGQAGVGAEQQLGGQYADIANQLTQSQLQGDISLQNALTPQWSQFLQSMPGAAQQLAGLPGQITGQQIQNATAMMPLGDYSRNLAESDYLRRQGVFQTALTGLPFTPGTSTNKQSGTGNIFDQLGGTISSGVTGGSGGFSSLGTKT